MKKFTKIVFIIVLVLAIVGAILLGAGIASGGSLASQRDPERGIRLARYMRAWLHEMEDKDERWEREDWDKDGSGLNGTAGKDGTEIVDADNVERLNVEILAGKAEIKMVSGNEIRISGLHASDYVNLEENDKELSISRELHEYKDMETLIIEIPEGKKFRELNLYAGAGELMASGTLSAEDASLTAEAGNLEAELLETEESELECNAGNLTVKFMGNLEDYAVYAECDMGNLMVNGEVYPGWKEGVFGTEGSSKNIEADCSVGNLNIGFENK